MECTIRGITVFILLVLLLGLISNLNFNETNVNITKSMPSPNQPTPTTAPAPTQAPSPTTIEKIFQIGFNRAGTKSLLRFFRANNINSVHWRYEGLALCRLMNENYNANKSLLHSLEHFSFFADFGVFVQRQQGPDAKFVNNSGGIEVYKLLVKEYPIENSLFILNIRNVYHWLHSRPTPRYDTNGYWNLKNVRAVANIGSNLELLIQWKTLWYRHICGATRYFEDNQINDHLLIFDVESDDIQKLIDFGHKHGISRMQINGLEQIRETKKNRNEKASSINSLCNSGNFVYYHFRCSAPFFHVDYYIVNPSIRIHGQMQCSSNIQNMETDK